MNLSANIQLTSVRSNDVQLLITVQLFKQTKMVKIGFDWNQCKSLHKQSLSLNRTGSQIHYQGKHFLATGLIHR